MEQNLNRIRGAGFGVAAISYDSPAILRNFAGRQHISYPLLSDPDSRIIRSFGILNEETPKGTPFYGIPYPGIYIVDTKGVVLGKYFEENFRERDGAGLILLKQFGIEPETPRAPRRAKHLSVTASASSAEARPGLKLTLALDISLDDKVHVYAPGVEGYVPIAWTIADSPGWKAGAAKFPESKKLRLEAINETVPVFTGKFRLTRDVTVGDEKSVAPLADAAGNVSIEGSIRYQACDDRLCYIPETVPLKWTLHLNALDRTRVPAEMQRKAQ